jgi:SAM-dependent methyltransferase
MELNGGAMSVYWTGRFAHEGYIWGETASPTTEAASAWFDRYKVRSVLVPGAGYGRNAKALSTVYTVDALELSPAAVAAGREWAPEVRFTEGSVLELPSTLGSYDAVYAYDVLHLFMAADREQMIRELTGRLNPHGLLYCTVFSDEDAAYGVGEEVEPGSYAYKPGKFAHFYREDELQQEWQGLTVLATGSLDEVLNYPDGSSHTYRLRYLVAQNQPRTQMDAGA